MFVFVGIFNVFIEYNRIDGSPSSPQPVRPVIKVSEIIDRKEKLKAYRLEKNSKKFQEIQDQRSPFIAVVPVGRWIEKKEKTRPLKMELINTPVKTALMNERVLKKSTVKNLIAKSTVKKENVMIFNGKKNENLPLRAKKKILAELNSVESTEKHEEIGILPFDLNSTFEISPEKQEVSEPIPDVQQRLRRSKSFADIVKLSKESVEMKAKILARRTPPAKFKRQVTAVIKKPIVLKKPAVFAAKKKEVKASVPVIKKKAQTIKATKSVEILPTSNDEPAQQVQAPKPAAKKQPVKRSYTYNLYSSSLDTQTKFLTMEHKQLVDSKDSFFGLLSEDQQMSVQLAIQQGNVLLTDKLGKFAEFLEKFEDDQNHPERLKRITEDDVENYWYLIYEEIDKMKSDFHQIHTIRKNILAAVASAKKRRTRRTYVPDEGTPKRSKRIAETVDTPK